MKCTGVTNGISMSCFNFRRVELNNFPSHQTTQSYFFPKSAQSYTDGRMMYMFEVLHKLTRYITETGDYAMVRHYSHR